MNTLRTKKHQGLEKGAALLIAVFALMLISAVAVSLVLMSGTGSAIDANYRNATKAFYSAYAGLEEGRGRLAPANPNTITASLPSPMGVSPTIQVQYITNPATGETVTPTNLASSNKYADNEFANEWGVPVTGTGVSVAASIASNSAVAGLSGPMYKWVRITGVTEASENMDVDGNGTKDSTYPIFYVGGHQYLDSPANAGLGGSQVYRVAALAVTPDNSRRMLQYDVVMNSLNLNIPAAVTLDGSPATVGSASSKPFYINGTDGSGSAPNPPGCTPSSPAEPAIGDVNNSDTTTIDAGLKRPTQYLGSCATTPCVQNVSSSLPSGPGVPVDYTTPTGLDGPQPDSLMQTLLANATNVNSCATYPNTTEPAPGACSFSDSNINLGSAGSPAINFVEGDLSMGPVTGYGILVVTGNLSWSGNYAWNGLILVIGQGTMSAAGGGHGEIDGSIFLANTRNTSGALLSTLGPTSIGWSGGGGNGVYYNSCWVSNSQNSMKKFNVLSFREILNF
jgi:Tfp pilus assembly protein PilX